MHFQISHLMFSEAEKGENEIKKIVHWNFLFQLSFNSSENKLIQQPISIRSNHQKLDEKLEDDFKK